ncbi:TetR/AcrR family transcriptional regulator [Alteromonas facilis]|uniref:TetR/AcrR family transcriptional regulator n=1 Tax=Alteromonas facilis TaxID=2048004 RepID=UPI000C28A805|nr:helix-turn-helix domain-containing protein [Alteromonas facilis]
MKTQQLRSQKTKEKILCAAEKLLLESPFEELTIPKVLCLCKVSVGGFYGRFASRDELLEEIYERYRQRRDVRLNQLTKLNNTADIPLKDRVKIVAQGFVDLHLSEAGILRNFLVNHWLISGKKPSNKVTQEISNHISQLSLFIAQQDFPLPQQHERIQTCIRYLVSLSKDHIVITPSSVAQIKNINRKQLISDISSMTCALIEQIKD